MILRTPNPDYDDYVQFRRDTANHRVFVRFDGDGYRHLDVANPEHGVRWWSVMVWPGHCTITGDLPGGYTFARETDMFAFFRNITRFEYADRTPCIDFSYWAEKLVGNSGACAFHHFSEGAPSFRWVGNRGTPTQG